MAQAIEIVNNTIIIHTEFLIHKDYSIINKEMILDVFVQCYLGQEIIVKSHDGENLEFSGFVDFIKFIAEHFSIPNDKITFLTHNSSIESFKHRHKLLGIFCSSKQHLGTIDKNLNNAKFVGLSFGRSTPSRLRLIYEIGQVFPDDSYMIFQPNINQLNNQYQFFSCFYEKEFHWLSQQNFSKDLTNSRPSGSISWIDSCTSYQNIWNHYQIEIVAETDVMNSHWFTEKTARCLATGKPFVLLAGQGSLAQLKNMGFKTFESVLDESYDQEIIPTRRINKLVAALKDLYVSQDKDKKITEMYNIAQDNIQLYNQYINTAKEE